MGARISAAAVAVFLVVASTSELRRARPGHAELTGATHVDRVLAAATVGRPTLVVTERPVLDRALGGDPSRRMTRVPLERSAVKQLHAAGRPMMAFDGARGVLQRLGAQFDSRSQTRARMPMRRCDTGQESSLRPPRARDAGPPGPHSANIASLVFHR